MSLQRVLLDHLTVCSKSNSLSLPTSIPWFSWDFTLPDSTLDRSGVTAWLDGDPIYLWGSKGNDELKKASLRRKSWLMLSPASSFLPTPLPLLALLLGLYFFVFTFIRQRKEKRTLTFPYLCLKHQEAAQISLAGPVNLLWIDSFHNLHT